MSIEAMELALYALEIYGAQAPAVSKTIKVLRQAIADAEKRERNFCERCGKRLGKNDWDVHTCTPPADAEKQEGWVLREVLFDDGIPISHREPPQRQWVGLTDEEKAEITDLKWWDWEDAFDIEGFIRAIEAKLREKNGG